ncbi:GNAT family N-acetyltransferase [Cytobacillus sp. Hz8]|uniref:GNAT family N-acetyltransferase n=1 Tax=Cytobacillus sp. Hz8 TaxID=3347168 RepID=UPI0035E18E95
MNITDLVEELDTAYIQTFANHKKTSWGHMFFNEAQPNYYDANHAQLLNAPEKPEEVINEVIQFYEQKRLTPRFYLYQADNLQDFIAKLKASGFGYEDFSQSVQQWNGQISEVNQDPQISFELVDQHNYQEVLNIECSITEFGGREIRKSAFQSEFAHPAFTYYLLRKMGVACCTACIFFDGQQARLESVATLETYRGQGLIGQLIYSLQQIVKEKGIRIFWVFPINERVEKVYNRYGFQTIAKIKTGHAFLRGKGIKEIRES